MEGNNLNTIDMNSEPIVPIAVCGAVLNIVTTNIHHSSKMLHMVEHDWPLMLIQETGIIKKQHTNMHKHWWHWWHALQQHYRRATRDENRKHAP
jgi:hypothetical protein